MLCILYFRFHISVKNMLTISPLYLEFNLINMYILTHQQWYEGNHWNGRWKHIDLIQSFVNIMSADNLATERARASTDMIVSLCVQKTPAPVCNEISELGRRHAWQWPGTKYCWAINPLWPSHTIWQHRSESALAQSMACCLTATSH